MPMDSPDQLEPQRNALLSYEKNLFDLDRDVLTRLFAAQFMHKAT